MVEGKLYKTKLCLLYQNGRCTRHSCNFAHGNAELRAHPPPFDGERNHRGGDLRGRPDKWHSPPRRGWEGREQRAYIDHAPSTSLERRSPRKRKFDHREEFSGNAKFVYPSDDRLRDGSFRSSSSKNTIVNELKQVQSDVKKLNALKVQLQCFLEDRDKEVDTLSFRLKELEAQLYEEREESHRVASKIKKFVKAHNRHSRIQDELKRSQARLHKLGVQLGSLITSYSAQGEDWTMNGLSEDEGGNQILNSGNGRDDIVSISKRGVSIDLNIIPGPDASLCNEERHEAEAIRSGKTSQQNRRSSLANLNNGADILKNGNSGGASSAVGHKKEKVPSAIIHFSKNQSSDAGRPLPLTGMAAHADDEGADLMATEKLQVIETALGASNHGSEHEVLDMQLPLSPPVLDKDNNSKNKSKEDDALDEETVHVDII